MTSRWKGQQRRRRSERLEAYYSTMSGVAIDGETGPRFTDPSAWATWTFAHRWSLALLAVCMTLLMWFFGSEEFFVYGAHISGTRLLTQEEIYHQTQLEGLSIFWVDPLALEAQLEENALIKDATVTVQLPHHVMISLVEREPVAVWQSATTSLYVDAEGALFALRGDASGALVIRDLRGEPIEPGDMVDTEAVQTALELATLIPDRRAFDWEPAAGISFITDGGWRVSFGDHYRLPLKAAAYEAFARQIAPFEKIELLDLSAPEHPYYRVLP